MPSGILTRNRIIIAVRKHIEPQEALAGAAVGVRVEKPLDDGVVVSGLQVIEARFRIEVVPPIPQRIDLRVAAGCAQDIAPGVVAVLGVDRAALEIELDYVALCVGDIVEGVIACDAGIPILPHGKRLAGIIVDEIQTPDEGSCGGVCDSLADNLAVLRHVFMLQTVRDLYRTNAGHIVFVGKRVAALGDAAESAALGPGEVRVAVSVVPVDRVAGCDSSRHGPGQGVIGLALVGNGMSVISRQQVRPSWVSVGVGNSAGGCVVDCSFNGTDIARRINGIMDKGGSRRSVRRICVSIARFVFQLVQGIVNIYGQVAVGSCAIYGIRFLDFGDVAVCVVLILILYNDVVSGALNRIFPEPGGGAGAVVGKVLIGQASREQR